MINLVRAGLVSLSISFLLVIFASAGFANQEIGSFVPTGNLNSARAKAASILLSNGLVLVIGGDNSVNSPLPAELYNSSRGIFTLTGHPANDFFNPVAVNLRDGRVYVTDGNIANIYHPATGRFSSASSPQFDLNCLVSSGLSDTCLQAVTLKTGKVLLTDGTKADLYDPGTDTIATIGSPLVPRTSFSMTLLNNGKVLIAGGISGAGGSPPDAELYDPSTGLFNSTGAMRYPRANHVAALIGGKSPQAGNVLLVGGAPPGAELYNPISGTFTTIDPREFSTAPPGYGATATTLRDGRVLIAGGWETSDTGDVFNYPMIYDPATGSFSATPFMARLRGFHSATLLPNGQVLIAGGDDVAGAAVDDSHNIDSILNSAELYVPNYMGFVSQVRFLTPAAQTVSGVIDVSAAAMSDVQSVKFYLDENLLESSPSLSFQLDTSTLSDGPHSLLAIGFGASPKSANLGSDSVIFNVVNHQVAISTPSSGQPSDNCQMTNVLSSPSYFFDMYIDGMYQNSNGACIDTTQVPNGLHTISMTGFAQNDGVIGADSISIHVANASAGEHVFIDNPVSGSDVSATFPLVTTAERGVARVKIYIDGIHSGSSPPFTFNINTRELSNGAHTISAVGVSRSGRQVTTDRIIVNVRN